MKKISLLIIWFFLVGSNTHKYYVSTSLYEFKEDTSSLQITIKIFKDDFINLINEKYEIDLGTNQNLNSKEIKELINKYLTSNVFIYFDDNKYEPFYLGLEENKEMFIFYMEIENLPYFKKIQLKNTILFDLFEKQQNIIHLKKGIKKRSFIFRKKSSNASFEF
tara:strand:- start:2124 stop:2615 length:492 start_codon:yes stop_codon:yes gene_type:complete